MQPEPWTEKRILIGVGAALVLLVVLLLNSVPAYLIWGTRAGRVTFDMSATTSVPIVVVDVPVRLIIPSIHLDALVEQAGLTAQGAMDVPKGAFNVAWFKLGTLPGDVGSAVISGHYGWKDGIPAAFDNMHLLKKGDKVYVINDRGATTTFAVREVRLYDQNANATNIFGSRDDKAHLNFITCEGLWNPIKKSYSNRLVVFTDLVTAATKPSLYKQ